MSRGIPRAVIENRLRLMVDAACEQIVNDRSMRGVEWRKASGRAIVVPVDRPDGVEMVTLERVRGPLVDVPVYEDGMGDWQWDLDSPLEGAGIVRVGGLETARDAILAALKSAGVGPGCVVYTWHGGKPMALTRSIGDADTILYVDETCDRYLMRVGIYFAVHKPEALDRTDAVEDRMRAYHLSRDTWKLGPPQVDRETERGLLAEAARIDAAFAVDWQVGDHAMLRLSPAEVQHVVLSDVWTCLGKAVTLDARIRLPDGSLGAVIRRPVDMFTKLEPGDHRVSLEPVAAPALVMPKRKRLKPGVTL